MKKLKKSENMKKYFIHFILLFPFIVQSQKQLTLQEIIDITLKNNFDIRIAQYNVENSKNKNTFGYAGGLPILTGNIGGDVASKNINQKPYVGSSYTEANAASNSLDAGINASIVLFNGFKILATKERLNYLQQQNEIILNQQIQNTIAAIMMKYYDIIRQESYLKIIQNSLEVSNNKLNIINEQEKVGMAKPADILQIQIDVNIAEQNLKMQQLLVDQDKADLMLLMGEKQYNPFTINDSIVVDNNLQMDSISFYLDRNPEFLLVDNQLKIYEQIIKEVSAQRYPSLKVDAGYNYNYSTYSYGLTKTNQVFGPTAGLTLQIPIYNGNIYRIQKKSAEIDLKIGGFQKENLLNSLKTDVFKTYLSYSTALQQIESQKTNYELAKKLMYIVMQNFQVNQATILEVKAAQTTYENAAYLLVNLQYSAKVGEIELKRLIYKLMY
jgi:outer membrane protein TolC